MERTIDKKKIIEEEKKELSIRKDVIEGKEVVCPECGEGILEYHWPRITCSNTNCDEEIIFN